MRTAILVDGGFYRKVALPAFGHKTPKDTATELYSYCMRHLFEKINNEDIHHDLYKIFYYDCPPLESCVYNPLTKKVIDMKSHPHYKWMNEFLIELKQKRKLVLRLGLLSGTEANYTLKYDSVKKLMSGTLKIDDLTEKDFYLTSKQKGVDMKIGIDIASLSYKKQVNQIVLISGDSDFVPASKLARREGIDFVLDPLGRKIKSDLFEHIDGLKWHDKKLKNNYK